MSDKIIFLATVNHVGTQFVRVLLDIHPRIDFVKVMQCKYNDNDLKTTMHDYCHGNISYDEFYNCITMAGYMDPEMEWTRVHAKKAQATIKNKIDPTPFISRHITEEDNFLRYIVFNRIKTVFVLRDPILSILTGLRRNPVVIPRILDGLKQVEKYSERAFVFTTDLWQGNVDKAMQLFDFLGLEHDADCAKFLTAYNPVNATQKSDELSKAKDAIKENKIHPILMPYVDKLKASQLQPFFESYGYKDLVWFE